MAYLGGILHLQIDGHGGIVASWLMHLTLDQAVGVRALARDIVLCSWARHFTLTVPLSIQGQVVQSPIMLTQDQQEFLFHFHNFSVRFSVYIVFSSVLSLKNLKLHNT